MRVEVLCDARQAASAGRRALGLLASCPASSIQFEILRATVWGMAAPLPTWRLLSERSVAREEILRAELRAALTTLADTGDLLQRRGGYWGPATARLVDLPGGSGRLLIGGVPSSALAIGSDDLQYHGPHRHFAKPAPELTAALPLEDFASWSRRPEASLQEWGRDVIDSFERQPYSPTGTEAFEFYMPTCARRGAPQSQRWSDSVGTTNGTLLARRMRVYGAREYRLVDVRAAGIVGACDLHGVDVRRLMYAFDLEAKHPVRARRLQTDDRAEWLFTSELPRAEQRTFAVFATLTIPDDRPFERRWAFARNEELALGMLRELGITLEQHHREGRR
jgi:hypothetical protein